MLPKRWETCGYLSLPPSRTCKLSEDVKYLAKHFPSVRPQVRFCTGYLPCPHEKRAREDREKQK